MNERGESEFLYAPRETPRFPLLFIAVIICVSHASHALLELHQAKFTFSFLFFYLLVYLLCLN